MITTKESVKTWLGNPPKLDDAVLTDAWNAAEAYVAGRCSWEGQDVDPPVPAPADLVQAVNLLTARYLARRNTPDGLVGLGELGAAQVSFSDVDVERLMNPWRFFTVA